MNDTITRANTAARATPRVRQIANQSGVAIAGIEGTGTGGRVTRADVQRAAEARTPRPKPATPTPEAMARVAAQAAADERDRLYAAVYGPAPEVALTATQAQLYATVYGSAES